jgi:hypothetical protein
LHQDFHEGWALQNGDILIVGKTQGCKIKHCNITTIDVTLGLFQLLQ